MRIVARRGLSIVELLIGITIGLFIIAGATVVMASQLGANRRQMLDVQVQNDVRVILSLIQNDLRTAQYYGRAGSLIYQTDPDATASNPFAKDFNWTSESISFNMSAQSPDQETGTIESGESYGYRFNANTSTAELKVGQNWQAINDPSIVQITDLSFKVTSFKQPLPCGLMCPDKTGCTYRVELRDVTVEVQARATYDNTVVRSGRATVRLRNDRPTCS